MPDSCLKLTVSYVYINEKSVRYIHFGVEKDAWYSIGI